MHRNLETWNNACSCKPSPLFSKLIHKSRFFQVTGIQISTQPIAHIRSRYSRSNSYECNHCERQFNSEMALENHCASKPDHPYCVACGIMFGDHHALQQHVRDAAVHQSQEEDTSYCQLCDKEFKDEHALQQHIENADVHLFCNECHRQFDDREAICQHLAASGRHFWCFPCWEDFGSYKKLESHCGSAHRGKGTQYECPLCDEGFRNPVAIADHIIQGCN
ncbi:hypothetical protein R3P38DRAFT_1723435 [Favolaschia claudopus]|uniref:C2H2-type domain-containing protein n=1 Tax=Favolaschia claudopus TaxID=2862362 RepID=A0AAW0A9Q5_9AGAR